MASSQHPNNILSYAVKERKKKQNKSSVLLPNFDEAWPRQNQPLQQNALCYNQTKFNHAQPPSLLTPTSSPTSSPTLLTLLQQDKKEVKAHAVLNASQTNSYNNTHSIQYNNVNNYQQQNQVAAHQATSSSSMAGFSTEQYLQYQQRNIYYENGQSYLPHMTYAKNNYVPPIVYTTTTQDFVPSLVKPLQEASQQCNTCTTQQYAIQHNDSSNNKPQRQITANNQVTPVTRPLQETSQRNTCTTQQYTAQPNYVDNNNKQQYQITYNNQAPFSTPWQKAPQQYLPYDTQEHVAQQNDVGNNKQQNQNVANNQVSPHVSPLQKIPQEDTIYPTQYATQPSCTNKNNNQKNYMATGNSKNKQQPIQHYAWMKFKYNQG